MITPMSAAAPTPTAPPVPTPPPTPAPETPVPFDTPVPGTKYEFTYTVIGNGGLGMFFIVGITDDIAHGIRTGLQGVASITDVTATVVSETRADVPATP